MNAKELVKLGLTEELADQVVILHGKDIEALKSKGETMQKELDTAKEQLTEANKTIEGFKKLDVDGIKKAADDWKAKAEKAEADSKSAIAQMRFDTALDAALAAAKAKNAKAVRALLKVEDLKLADDGSLVGLKEQLEKVQTESAYLFDDGKEQPRIVAGGNNQGVLGDKVIEAARIGAGLVTPTKTKE